LKDVQAAAASSPSDPKAAEAAKAQATLITSQIASVEQQIGQLSQQAQAGSKPAVSEKGAGHGAAANKAPAGASDAEKAQRRLAGETTGTTVDTWA
jgi:hypothetical protein